MADPENGRPPTTYGEKLVQREFSAQIVSLAEQRAFSREVLDLHIGAFDPEIDYDPAAAADPA